MEEFVTHIDGLRMRYFAAGSGPALLLLHGVGNSALDWQWVIPRLAKGYRLYAPDLPGYSLGAVDGIVHTSAAYSQKMMLLVRELGIPSTVVVGHSIGGLVALRMALEHPELVSILVLVDSAGLGKMINPLLSAAITPSGEFAKMAAATWYGGWLRSGLRSCFLFANPFFAPWEWFLEQQRLACIPSFLSAELSLSRTVIDFYGQREVLADELPKLEMPVFILWGNHDQIIPVDHGHNAVKKLKNGQIVTFSDCGHVPHVENPAEFSNTLRKLLEKHAVARETHHD